MALGQRVKIGIVLVAAVAVPLVNVAVVAGALDWMGPPPNLTVLIAWLQLCGAGFVAVTALRRCDDD